MSRRSLSVRRCSVPPRLDASGLLTSCRLWIPRVASATQRHPSVLSGSLPKSARWSSLRFGSQVRPPRPASKARGQAWKKKELAASDLCSGPAVARSGAARRGAASADDGEAADGDLDLGAGASLDVGAGLADELDLPERVVVPAAVAYAGVAGVLAAI